MDPAGVLARNDSYHFFEPLGDLLKTGPTNTNVMDVRLLLVGKGRDTEDVLVSRSRQHEERIPLEKVKADLIASGKLETGRRSDLGRAGSVDRR